MWTTQTTTSRAIMTMSRSYWKVPTTPTFWAGTLVATVSTGTAIWMTSPSWPMQQQQQQRQQATTDKETDNHQRRHFYNLTTPKTLCEPSSVHASVMNDPEKNYLLHPHTSKSWMGSGGGTGASSATTAGGSMHSSHVMGTFHQLFPLRQLWKPAVEYPLWDHNWDGKASSTTRPKESTADLPSMRHMILIPHGQDDNQDELDEEDEHNEDDDDDDREAYVDTIYLTKQGRLQAEQTGKRLAQVLLLSSSSSSSSWSNSAKRRSVSIWVSDKIRAKETAEIIAKFLPGAKITAADPMMNEGRPCHNIPGGQVYHIQIQSVDQDHSRIENAFRKYFFRPDDNDSDEQVVILIGHANVLRYFTCRALQLPPETYARYSLHPCSLTYLTIEAGSGIVSCRTLGDVAHLTPTAQARFLW